MDYFTTDNTFGFTDEQLLHLNEAHDLLVEFAVTQREPTPDRAQVEKSVGDTLNDEWRPDCWTSADLVRAAIAENTTIIDAQHARLKKAV